MTKKSPALIMVAGLPGSGKSFFAKRFAQVLGATYVGSDELRKKLDLMGKYSAKDKLTVYREMAKITDISLDNGHTVVADATFYLASIRKVFYKLAADRKLPLHIFKIEAAEALVKQRLQQPRKDSEASFRVYEKVKEQFEPICRPYLTIGSSSNNISSMLARATEYLQDAGA